MGISTQSWANLPCHAAGYPIRLNSTMRLRLTGCLRGPTVPCGPRPRVPRSDPPGRSRPSRLSLRGILQVRESAGPMKDSMAAIPGIGKTAPRARVPVTWGVWCTAGRRRTTVCCARCRSGNRRDRLSVRHHGRMDCQPRNCRHRRCQTRILRAGWKICCCVRAAGTVSSWRINEHPSPIN